MKRYISPLSTCVVFTSEGMIATSSSIKMDNENKIESAGDIRSRRYGWSSDNWSDNDEE